MQRLFAIGLALVLGLVLSGPPGPARAGENLIVVELFTSEACTNCQPAEAVMRDLSQWSDILPLSLHVDYWDYMGWKDPYALKVNVDRQMVYAARTERRRLFTPLIVVGGYDLIEGVAPMKIVDMIRQRRGAPTGVSLDIQQDGETFVLQARSEKILPQGAVVVMVTFMPQVTSTIRQGESDSRRAEHTNVVTGWYKLASWDGSEPLILRDKLPESEGVAVLIQSGAQDMIVAAKRLR